ncbi:MAG: signal recognition particle-docking protein FtsY [Bacteroidota bacterium]
MFNGLDRLKSTLARTREGIVGRVVRLVSGRSAIDDDLLEQLEEILIAADVGTGVSMEIIGAIRERVRNEGRTAAGDVLAMLKEEVRVRLQGDGNTSMASSAAGGALPYVIMVVGINGAGKTTTIGKLAHRYVRDGRKVVLAAADTFRAAANEQLEIWAQRAGADLIRQSRGSDPAAVAFDAVAAGTARGADVVIIDTAGRLHTKVNLMEELKKIRRVIQKNHPEAPHEVLLVLDASTGQNGLQQARQFGGAVGVTGIVLTKLDGTAKGGIVLAIARELNLPVKYIGVGEAIDDLEPFDQTAFVEAMFAS